MSDNFQPIPLEKLTTWIFDELEHNESIFGIPQQLFFRPQPADRVHVYLYDQFLETPFGVAAGPHSQMAQNIIAAWLCGGRFMELKTVQTLDELDVSKPCIDMQDEGYNCEWSQELKVHQSFEEYLRAWVLIHALHHKLGFPGDRPGMIFNMSVGYDLEGIQKENVQWFLTQMRDASEPLQRAIDTVAAYVPEVKQLDIPAQLSDNVCVSTMHGCPPDEIGKICRYLMEEWGLHTNVKLNPTLLGPERVREILNERLGFDDVTVPDEAFGHDLKYADALELLKDLRSASKEAEVVFGVKLCNTLEVVNHRDVFAEDEGMMYMSGRAHHPLAVNLAAKLQDAFNGDLLCSFAGGAEFFNVADLLASGMKTVTTCSDILRSGGYARMVQYVEAAEKALADCDAQHIDDFSCRKAFARDGGVDEEGRELGAKACMHANLSAYAEEVLNNTAYQKQSYDRSRTKTTRPLGLFDCIKAPCTDECPISQKVPDYMRAVRDGRMDDAIRFTRQDNPMPTILGRACNHLCENTCVRTHYDEPLAIREIKRYIMDKEENGDYPVAKDLTGSSVAVIGGGPCGLSVCYFLLQAGFKVTVFEAREYCGGMVSGSIPGYRATQEAIDQDMAAIERLGVEIRYGQKAGKDFTFRDLKDEGFVYIVVGAGAQRGISLGMDGEDCEGVLDGLEFLRAAREQQAPALGKRVGVIGGGDVAMDCARTADRLTDGEVAIIYRRTMKQMPAQKEELDGLLEEGIKIIELASPSRVITDEGRMSALECHKMELGEPDASGRRRPVKIPDADFEIPLDHLIVAIGQRGDFDFVDTEVIKLNRKGFIEVDPETMETGMENVFAGGDAVMEGPATIVKAFGDGKKIAAQICRREGVEQTNAYDEIVDDPAAEKLDRAEMIARRSRRAFRVPVPHLAPEQRRNFKEVVETLSDASAEEEASRCLECDRFCSLCTTVCPNRAIITYETKPMETELPVLEIKGGKTIEKDSINYVVRQRYQVAVITDFCNECGNCATFCPTAGRPFRDKPRIYLNRAEYDAQDDNAFMVFQHDGMWMMQAKYGGEEYEMVVGSRCTYKSPRVMGIFDERTRRLVGVKLSSNVHDNMTIDLKPCAEMYALLKGLQKSASYLPPADSDERAPLK